MARFRVIRRARLRPELDLTGAGTWSFIWKVRGHNQGLLIYPGALVPTAIRADADLAVWDVTGRWGDLRQSPISSVTPVWTRHTWIEWTSGVASGERATDVGESDLCLITVVLAAGDDAEAVITLGRAYPAVVYSYNPTNLAVFFSVANARAAGVTLPGGEHAVP